MLGKSARGRSWLVVLPGILTACAAAIGSPQALAAPPEASAPKFLFQKGDRVAWVGSSSTRIGVWPRTMEFLLRTRHPGLDLEFTSYGVPGGTFRTGVQRLDGWMNEFQPSVVFLNYGGNDAGSGKSGLPGFKQNMSRCVAKVEARGARVVLITPQAADARRSGPAAAARRTLYAETMLGYGRGRGWTVVDVHHPLGAMQAAGQKADPNYSILRDSIHLTPAAYVGWGFLLYDRLDLPFVRDEAVLTADGQVTWTENCEIHDIRSRDGVLSFTRADVVLPVLPPGPLPPRLSVPLEDHSRYLLKVTGLSPGDYEILCEGRSIGVASFASLSVGLNLNTLLLDGHQEPPWAALARAVWDGQRLDEIGRTRWRFEVRKQLPSGGEGEHALRTPLAPAAPGKGKGP